MKFHVNDVQEKLKMNYAAFYSCTLE